MMNGVQTPTMDRQQVRKNDSGKGWVVQKFGGTSVGKFPNKVCSQLGDDGEDGEDGGVVGIDGRLTNMS
jgi:hypothetical protein